MNAATTIVTMMAAKMAAERNAVIAALQKANAYSSATALARDALPSIGDDNLASMCKQGVLKKLDDGRYYLDKTRLQAIKAKEAQDLKIALMIMLALFMVAIGFVIYVVAKQ